MLERRRWRFRGASFWGDGAGRGLILGVVAFCL